LPREATAGIRARRGPDSRLQTRWGNPHEAQAHDDWQEVYCGSSRPRLGAEAPRDWGSRSRCRREASTHYHPSPDIKVLKCQPRMAGGPTYFHAKTARRILRHPTAIQSNSWHGALTARRTEVRCDRHRERICIQRRRGRGGVRPHSRRPTTFSHATQDPVPV
jgi:hypothetical protein